MKTEGRKCLEEQNKETEQMLIMEESKLSKMNPQYDINETQKQREDQIGGKICEFNFAYIEFEMFLGQPGEAIPSSTN